MATNNKISNGCMTVRIGLVVPPGRVVVAPVCDVRTGILWASDGRLITLEGGYLIPA